MKSGQEAEIELATKAVANTPELRGTQDVFGWSLPSDYQARSPAGQWTASSPRHYQAKRRSDAAL